MPVYIFTNAKNVKHGLNLCRATAVFIAVMVPLNVLLFRQEKIAVNRAE